MAEKVVLIADPGIDGAFAVALALHDPDVDVLGLAATAGNVVAEQATKNVHILIEHIDPPRWPRLGAALQEEYEMDGTRLHGPGGLGGVTFPCAELHHPHASDKLLVDLVRQHPKEITVVCLGPLTVLARALDRDPDLPALVKRLICMGGAWRESGDASAVAEFHFFCDPAAARQVLRCGAPITLLPLDVTRKLVFSPSDLLELPALESRTCKFLRQIVPFGIGATSNLFGVEGFHLNDVLGIAALTIPQSLRVRPMSVDVETRGELTRGMSVVDSRSGGTGKANVELALDVEVAAVKDHMRQVLQRAI